MTSTRWISAAQGDASGFWFQSLLAGSSSPSRSSGATLAAIARTDAARPSGTSRPARTDGAILGNAGTEFIWAGGRLADAWPANPGENQYSKRAGVRVSRRS